MLASHKRVLGTETMRLFLFAGSQVEVVYEGDRVMGVK